nr:hypothetical protein [Tanacetum cinerariifolium]
MVVSFLLVIVLRLNDKLASSNASFAKSKAKEKERKKNIKSLTKSLDNLHVEVARLSTALNQATMLEAEKDEEILRLKTTSLEFSSFFQDHIFAGAAWAWQTGLEHKNSLVQLWFFGGGSFGIVSIGSLAGSKNLFSFDYFGGIGCLYYKSFQRSKLIVTTPFGWSGPESCDLVRSFDLPVYASVAQSGFCLFSLKHFSFLLVIDLLYFPLDVVEDVLAQGSDGLGLMKNEDHQVLRNEQKLEEDASDCTRVDDDGVEFSPEDAHSYNRLPLKAKAEFSEQPTMHVAGPASGLNTLKENCKGAGLDELKHDLSIEESVAQKCKNAIVENKREIISLCVLSIFLVDVVNLAWAEPNKCSGEADMSKDTSSPESPKELRRSCWRRYTSSAASVGFERSLSMHQTKDEFATISEHATKPLSVILQLELEKLSRPANVPPLRDARVSPPTTKESIVTSASKSLELSTNVDLTAFVVTSKHNEEMVNVEVDGSDPKMIDDTVVAMSGHDFVQVIYVTLDDDVELLEVGSGRSSSPNDAVVAIFVGEKGDGLVPFFATGKEVAANSSVV